MTDQQQPRTAAQQALYELVTGGVEFSIADKAIHNWVAELNTQIAALRDTVAALQEELSDWTQLVHARLNTHSQMISKAGTDCDICEGRGWSINVPSQTMYPCSWCNGKGKVNIAALESPASAPEPDPLCAREWCGHPKSEHGGGEANCYHMDMPTMSCVLKCACERFVPQPSPATAHQEPPDAVLVCQCGHSKGHHHPYCHGNHEWMPSGCRCREFVPQAESIDAVNLLIRDINRFGQLRFQFGMSLEHGDMENAEENRIAARELEVKIEAAIRAYGRDGAR